jgi:GNAT superfamily N-acetyltransferase
MTVRSGSVGVRRLVAPTRVEVEQLAAIFDRYRTHYGESEGTSRTASWLEVNISSGRLEAFVAETGGEFIGLAIAMVVPASLRLGYFWQIRDLYVVPSHRRNGVGKALLDSVRAAAISAGAMRLSLQTEADNTSALRLYAESGYAPVEGYQSLVLPLNPGVLNS